MRSSYARRSAVLGLLIATLAGVTTVTAGSPGIEGLWRLAGDRGAVNIVAHGDRLSGYLTGRSPPAGKPLLAGFLGGPRVWSQGVITDPSTGRSYQGRLELVSPDKLRVTGCVLKVLCRSQLCRRPQSPEIIP